MGSTLAGRAPHEDMQGSRVLQANCEALHCAETQLSATLRGDFDGTGVQLMFQVLVTLRQFAIRIAPLVFAVVIVSEMPIIKVIDQSSPVIR